ncbi:MAG TPA: glycosyl hydrolase family 2 [Verrucomicrobiae bacterium]|jgi:exo-1,4-beta-D-glucosaminidase
MTIHFVFNHVILALAIAGFARQGLASETPLEQGWKIQSSAKVNAGGAAISTPGFATANWYDARVPSTVVGTLVEDKVYSEPLFGMNFRSLPGMSYPIGANFSLRPMPADSPFKVSWWYRTEFDVPASQDGQVWLGFDGINYRANVWVNGKLVANDHDVAGAYRTYNFNITGAARPGAANALAVEIFAPEPDNLGITWVDWNPAPPDKDMGLWRGVHLSTTGPVALRSPQVVTKLDMPLLDTARLTVWAEVRNASGHPVRAIVRGEIAGARFEQAVELPASGGQEVEFTPEKFPQLAFSKPRLWWPSEIGPQNLYDLKLEAIVDGKVSDHDTIRFGMREATSELNDKGYRVFKINGRPILVRGGGWAPDIFLRDSAERERQEIAYVKDMHLNAIRFEGKTESGRFLDLCDQAGIMVIAGWCCCDFWEKWPKWTDTDYGIAAQSLRDQTRRIRNHPCVITWWYGSDNPPNERAEKNYLAVLKEVRWPDSAQSSASAKPTKLGAPTGIRMTGPYDYVPPVYWYVDKTAGGACGFNTETSPGPAIPPIESLRRMLPPDHLWPIDEFWSYHAGGGPFKHLDIFTEALTKRLGAPAGVEDYSRKAQLMAYDGERAMFEAYGRNKFDSTGVIQWMMNNAWPSVIWHLYDYYLRPGGGYFGAKKACEPLHIQYSYDDRSIVVVNNYFEAFLGLRAKAEIFTLDGTPAFSGEASLDAAPNSSARVLTLPEQEGASPVYFVRLALSDASGRIVSRNVYWLSKRGDTMGEPKEGSDWYYTPTRQFADFTALGKLQPADLKMTAVSEPDGQEETTRVRLENIGHAPAFLVRVKITSGRGGEEILPVLWEDNYLTLMPGESREITARHARAPEAVAEAQGWNTDLQIASAPHP